MKSTRTGYFVEDVGWTGEHPYWWDMDQINYGTDDYGFSAIPGGHRNQWGGFGNLGIEAHYWTSTVVQGQEETNAEAFGMRNTQSDLYRFGEVQVRAFNVRCVRDVQ